MKNNMPQFKKMNNKYLFYMVAKLNKKDIMKHMNSRIDFSLDGKRGVCAYNLDIATEATRVWVIYDELCWTPDTVLKVSENEEVSFYERQVKEIGTYVIEVHEKNRETVLIVGYKQGVDDAN